MNRLKEICRKVIASSIAKYVVVAIVGSVLVIFVGENSYVAHLRNRHRIAQLESEISHYEAEFNSNQSRIRQMQVNPKAVEKIARERYFMKKADEDIFVLSDDERESQYLVPVEHETVE